jgi:hypothetical protein
MAPLITALLILSTLFWLLHAVVLVRAWRLTPRLAALAHPAPASWPPLSLVIPACNEAHTLGPAMASRLAEDYPALELIIVDDRSSDGTGAVADAIAAADPRVRVLHVDALPDNWLGKTHALARGTDAASGDFILYTDADVHLAPGTLRRAVACCEARGLDHLAVLPAFGRASFAMELPFATFMRGVLLATRVWAVEDPERRESYGVGAFNLVRRTALERTPGLASMKMEILDDLALGQMLKDHGARSSLALGHGAVALDFYGSAGELMRGMEKHGFRSLGRLGWARLVGFALGFWLVESAPLVALAACGHPLLQAAGLALLTLALATSVGANRFLGRPLVPALLFPIGTAMLIAFALRSGWLALRRGGIAWRGTIYPLAALRAGMRLRFP